MFNTETSTSTQTLRCPICKLINPANAMRCDCGYIFQNVQQDQGGVSLQQKEYAPPDYTWFRIGVLFMALAYGVKEAPSSSLSPIMQWGSFFAALSYCLFVPSFLKLRFFVPMTLFLFIVSLSLSTFASPSMFQKLGNSKEKAAQAQIVTLTTALDAYRLDVGRYPTTDEGLDALRRKPDHGSWDGPYLSKDVPRDPWGRAYVYRSPGDDREYDLYSLGEAGEEGGKPAKGSIRAGSTQLSVPMESIIDAATASGSERGLAQLIGALAGRIFYISFQIVFLGLIFQGMRNFVRAMNKHSSKPMQQKAERVTSPSPQIVGMPCAVCGEKISIAPLARYCHACGSAYHRKCAQGEICPKCG